MVYRPYYTGVQNTHYILQSTIRIQYIVLTDTLQYGNISMWCFLSLIDKTHANEGRCQKNCGNVHEIRKDYILRCTSQSESLIRLWKFPKLKRKVMRVSTMTIIHFCSWLSAQKVQMCPNEERKWIMICTPPLSSALSSMQGRSPQKCQMPKKFTSLMHWLSFPTSKGVE